MQSRGRVSPEMSMFVADHVPNVSRSSSNTANDFTGSQICIVRWRKCCTAPQREVGRVERKDTGEWTIRDVKAIGVLEKSTVDNPAAVKLVYDESLTTGMQWLAAERHNTPSSCETLFLFLGAGTPASDLCGDSALSTLDCLHVQGCERTGKTNGSGLQHCVEALKLSQAQEGTGKACNPHTSCCIEIKPWKQRQSQQLQIPPLI